MACVNSTTDVLDTSGAEVDVFNSSQSRWRHSLSATILDDVMKDMEKRWKRGQKERTNRMGTLNSLTTKDVLLVVGVAGHGQLLLETAAVLLEDVFELLLAVLELPRQRRHLLPGGARLVAAGLDLLPQRRLLLLQQLHLLTINVKQLE